MGKTHIICRRGFKAGKSSGFQGIRTLVKSLTAEGPEARKMTFSDPSSAPPLSHAQLFYTITMSIIIRLEEIPGACPYAFSTTLYHTSGSSLISGGTGVTLATERLNLKRYYKVLEREPIRCCMTLSDSAISWASHQVDSPAYESYCRGFTTEWN